mmetsp:Transcript_4122/g.12978  ORF Transcript_4122/g.12978 Transcript_4122/m.12978 type:complete len:216 (+) Transcript_4122:1491-2138(+)
MDSHKPGKNRLQHEKDLRVVFDMFEADGDGQLNAWECAALLEFMQYKQEGDEAATIKRRKAKVSVGLLLLVILLGTIAFYNVEEGWTIVDSFYFSIITLTTVGLGDFTPDFTSNGGLTLWYFYTLAGLVVAGGVVNFFIDAEKFEGFMSNVYEERVKEIKVQRELRKVETIIKKSNENTVRREASPTHGHSAPVPSAKPATLTPMDLGESGGRTR